MNEIEVWRDVAGYEGLYQVSNLGRVKSLERIVYNFPRRINVQLKEKILKQTLRGANLYYAVNLSKNNKSTMLNVHRLVAEAFAVNTDPGSRRQVNHKDGDKANNRAENLEWVTPQENKIHAVYTGLDVPNYGVKPVICLNNGKTYPSLSAAAREFGVDNSAISKVCKGNRSSANGYVFEYAV